jgi:branched-chain amino acid transport system permease protein
MNLQIVALLGQDGATNGAIYALLALAIVMVFAVTRILFIPQGEFVAFGALTMGAIQSGKPLTVAWLLAALCVASALQDVFVWGRRGPGVKATRRALIAPVLKLAYGSAMVTLAFVLPLAQWPMAAQTAFVVALLAPLGPLLYRLVFLPVAAASPLVLLIVSIALHVVLVGIGLLTFGAEGAHTQPFTDSGITLADMRFNDQALWVIGLAMGMIAALYLLFERTLYGKALRAAAMNRMGARLMGISPAFAGQAMFLLAALIGVLSGVMIAPVTTIYYDSGFLISLKGFVGAIIGGLASYPLAAAGALLVGLLEAFSAFFASSYKEVIVFVLIIPVLVWRSLNTHHVEEEE